MNPQSRKTEEFQAKESTNSDDWIDEGKTGDVLGQEIQVWRYCGNTGRDRYQVEYEANSGEVVALVKYKYNHLTGYYETAQILMSEGVGEVETAEGVAQEIMEAFTTLRDYDISDENIASVSMPVDWK